MSPTSQQTRVKLASLRQQIWMGVPSAVRSNGAEHLVDVFVKTPLSWGVSRHALMHYPTDRSEATLK